MKIKRLIIHSYGINHLTTNLNDYVSKIIENHNNAESVTPDKMEWIQGANIITCIMTWYEKAK